ncbi:hypothetical protein [Bacillus subtilis]|uniref:Uncharacterized protein n=1 Tax=Bacillus subtilis TaxID=1423 RepID=A0A8I1WEL0_BACIU|nr:hypothetical protein [Bacillus subtilis]MBO3794274.1 hypothetical protein [Bacillus subtilis]MED3626589.1 hypothetical protein [Bacillus subtilis]
MVEENSILKFKQSYEEVYQIQIKDQEPSTFIFRPIGREEYKQVVVLDLDLGDYQEIICSQCVLYPENYDFSKGRAGIAEVVAHSILDVSGLLPQQADEMLEQFRAEMMQMDYQADCMIHEAFPEYSLEEISSWTLKKTMYYLSRAEWILRTLKGSHFTYLSEEENQTNQVSQINQNSNETKLAPMTHNNSFEQQSDKAAQSEEEVLAMLAGAGAKVAQPSSTMDEVKPELNWFSYMDELKGEFE